MDTRSLLPRAAMMIGVMGLSLGFFEAGTLADSGTTVADSDIRVEETDDQDSPEDIRVIQVEFFDSEFDDPNEGTIDILTTESTPTVDASEPDSATTTEVRASAPRSASITSWSVLPDDSPQEVETLPSDGPDDAVSGGAQGLLHFH